MTGDVHASKKEWIELWWSNLGKLTPRLGAFPLSLWSRVGRVACHSRNSTSNQRHHSSNNMFPNSQKRAADPAWNSYSPAKVSRLSRSARLDVRAAPSSRQHYSSPYQSSPLPPASRPTYSPPYPNIAHTTSSKETYNSLYGNKAHTLLSRESYKSLYPNNAPKSARSTQPSFTGFKPVVRHQPHPDSRLCQDFHWVPYPLGLMSHDSWDSLHNYGKIPTPPPPNRCPVCRKPRKATPHMRKLFLVAERLTRDYATVPLRDKEQNEQLTWEVNYELGILDPFVEDADQVPGGKKSKLNKWHPYQNQYEMEQAMSLAAMDGGLTQVSWSLWYGLQMNLQKMLGQASNRKTDTQHSQKVTEKSSELVTGQNSRVRELDEIDLRQSPDNALFDTSNIVPTIGIPTPPSSFPNTSEDTMRREAGTATKPPPKDIYPPFPTRHTPGPSSVEKRVPSPQDDKRITSYKTLQDFYSLLDQIERTSYVGALFLEAYAEHLRDDACRDCWLKHNVVVEVK